MKDEFQKNTPTLHVAAKLEKTFEVDGASSSKGDEEKIDVIKAEVQSSTTSKICDAVELVIILYSIPYIIQIMSNIAFHIHSFCLQNGCRYFGNRLVTKAQLAKLNDSSLSKLTCRPGLRRGLGWAVAPGLTETEGPPVTLRKKFLIF